ncbi:helix-turn-helix domain-containing protein [Methylobacterium sp. J-068]|uniref:helix-turn-helix domain-containing protein n=1 Tax=Methylobacterium sp. J-068 TaxID=2836649 RepID=UPI001FB86529|nr:helix-turn-helix transcriptional regulator [Methylobacterium sp. J-068]MCJ2035907.1 helix-turn-helix domain-containing protein [Methylobacterium sp. J-068]
MATRTMAERIKCKRESLGLSKADLARAVNVTTTAVWNWEENGSKPRKDVLQEIAKALQVSQEYIISGDKSDKESLAQAPAEIIRLAEIKIAALNGVPADRVKLRLEILPEK